MQQITLLGPLSVEIDLKVKEAASLIGDAHIAKHSGIIFGGPALRIARLLRSIGYSVNICSYIGNDEFGNKILENMKNEDIEHNTQKIPNISTPILCKLSDKKDYSYYITETKDLALWQFRLKTLKDTGIIYLAPSIPTPVQIDIVKQFKNSTIIVRKPLDKSLELFKCQKKLIVLLNEYEVFQIFAEYERGYFYAEKILLLNLFKNHTVLLETRDAFCTMNLENKIVNIPLYNLRHNYAMMDEYCITGILAALAGGQNHMNAFLWGLICSIQNGKNQPLNKLDILSKLTQFTWIESIANSEPTES